MEKFDTHAFYCKKLSIMNDILQGALTFWNQSLWLCGWLASLVVLIAILNTLALLLKK